MRHTPVMVKEIVNLLNIKPNKTYVDSTVGTGGHTLALFNKCKDIKVYAIDRDIESIEEAKNYLKKYAQNIEFLWINYKDMGSVIKKKIDGIIFDLGISSFQLDSKERGFSYRFQAPLDMRMNRKEGLPGYKLLEKMKIDELEFILKKYGEENYSRRIARLIYNRKPKTTDELKNIVKEAIGPRSRCNITKILARVFQAIRIFINDELNNLEEGLKEAVDLLKLRGRICVISYHSLEDRIVKNFFRECPYLKVITKKPIRPSKKEIEKNNRVRSAKLRCAEKIYA